MNTTLQAGPPGLSRIASCMTPRTASLGVRYPVGGMVPPQRRCTSAPESLVNMDLESDVREVFQMEKVRDKGILTIPGKILEKTFHEDLDEVDASTYHDVIVGDVLKRKERFREPHSIDENATVFDAIREMESVGIGSLLVHDEDNIVGIFTERDYLNKIAVKGRSSRETRVKDVMTSPVWSVPTYAKIGPVMNLLTQNRFRHVPVVNEDNKVIGVISIGDLVREVSADYKLTIAALREYIERLY